MSNPGVDRVAVGAAASLGAPTSTSRRKVTTSATILPTSIHVVIHLGVPIAHICPMCGGDDGQEANCGAVPECRKHPDVLKNVSDDLLAKDSLHYIAPLIAPEIVHNEEAVDVVEILQCALRHEAERAIRRGGAHLGAGAGEGSTTTIGRITDVRIERTVPLGGKSTVLSFTLDATSPEAAEAAMRGVASLRHVAEASEDFPVPAHCAGGDDMHRARVGALREVQVKMGCQPGLHGARCQYSCRTRWQRFDQRVLPESSSPEEASSTSSSTVQRTITSTSEGRKHNTAAEFGETVHPVHRKLLLSGEEEEEERTSRSLLQHFPAHMKHATEFRDDVVARTHFFHGGDHTKQHKMSMILNGCSVGCRGHANLAQHHCSEYIDSGRSDDAHLEKCTSYLADTEHYCQVSVKDGDCPLENITPWREQNTETHTDACEVCGLLRHWGQHGLHHEDDAAPLEEPFTSSDADTDASPELGGGKSSSTAKKKGTWYTSMAEMHARDQAAREKSRAAEAKRVSERHGFAPREHGRAYASLHETIAAGGDDVTGPSHISSLGAAHNAALRELTGDLLRSHSHSREHRMSLAAALGKSAPVVDDDVDDDVFFAKDGAFHDHVHSKLLQHAARKVAQRDDDQHGGVESSSRLREEESAAFYPHGPRDVMAGQFPACLAATTCDVKCSAVVDRALGACVAWVDADEPDQTGTSPSSSRRAACVSALSAARVTCGEASDASNDQITSCYEPAAAGFRSLLKKS